MKNPKKILSDTGATSSGKLPVVLSLTGYHPVKDILVVGCGGTGAYVVSYLSRLLSVINKEFKLNRHEEIKLYLADGDIVEEKNLIRQHFIAQDIGRNKAEVLGERYSGAFGIQIGVIKKDLEKISDFKFLRIYPHRSIIIVGCVDNNASRKVIHEWFIQNGYNYNENYSSKFWIDSGNEERNGQVVCGYRTGLSGLNSNNIKPKIQMTSRSGYFSLPCVTEIYPNILKNIDQFNSQISCAERSASAPQNMQTNITAANIIMNYLNKIIANEPLKSHCVEFSIDNNFSTKLNTPKNIDIVDFNRRRRWEA